MVNVKTIVVKKDVDIPYVQVLGMQILRMVKKGYENFKIKDEGDKIIIKTWRIRRRGEIHGST